MGEYVQGFLFKEKSDKEILEGEVLKRREELREENKLFKELSRPTEVGSGSGWFDPNL